MAKEDWDIDQVLFNEFSGVITPEEKLFLDEWINESTANRRYFSEQKKLWSLVDRHQKMKSIDEQKAYRNVADQLFSKPKISFITSFQRIAAILILPLLIASIYYFYNNNQIHDTQSAVVYNTAETPLGMRSSLTLPDGTKVWLNAGSKLSYPVTFSNQYRAVRLVGEAYFEVKKDEKWPFLVNSGNMNIVVYGTTFNCNAYPENNEIQTVLVEGRVTLLNESSTVSEEMHPGELAVFEKTRQQISKTKTDLQKYVAWKSGMLMFRDDRMDKVVEKLERWYNVDIEIKDKEISDYIYNATFVDESLDQVLKMLSLSAPISYVVSERSKLQDQTFEKQTVKLYSKKL
jgi:ferric-dicitrate binding protein FerR (iron transport regulator)